ncbi:serpin family protein [Deferrisoma camini]|uniref:serpin family protein n=1 Tax=Deferrisoma camini TaxID=1035120 RepID=UPI00046D539E|nr:serpin family protein [Deferrisoma camini]
MSVIPAVLRLVVWMTALALLHAPVGSHSEAAPAPGPDGAAGDSGFALELYRCSPRDGNVVVSPPAVELALTAVAEGARGRTRAELEAVLPSIRQPLRRGGPEPTGEEGGLLRIALGLWGQEGAAFAGPFLKAVRSRYGAVVGFVDYARAPEQARQRINAWVRGRTGGRIEELVPPGRLSARTVLVVTSAVAFRGVWEHAFDPARTVSARFDAEDGSVGTVRMMSRPAPVRLRYAERDGVQVVELPFRGGGWAMLVALPRRGRALRAFEDRLAPAYLERLVGAMEFRSVRVALPRFAVCGRTEDLGPRGTGALVKMGVRDAFDPVQADFSGIVPGERVFVDGVLHAASVTLDEQGARASASTGALLSRGAAPDAAVRFRADRPFLFLIRHRRTGAVLFIGRLARPPQPRGGD